LQQLILPIEQIFRHRIIGRQTDLPLATLVAERATAQLLEPFARHIIDAQICGVPDQQAEHHAAVEQPNTAEHAAWQRSKRAE
jgi:hypothetical protein